MSITDNIERIGNFTSSEIYKLLTKDRSGKDFGAPAKTYIAEKNLERIVGISLKDNVDSKPLVWGRILEQRVFNLLGIEYTYNSQETILHSTISYWAGSPDGKKINTVMDIKCPYTLKSFIQLVLPLYFGFTGIDAMNALRFGFNHNGIYYTPHADAEKYYWQLVSNAIITKSEYAELLVYMPYYSELKDIQQNVDGDSEAYFIWASDTNKLPYILDHCGLKNLNVINFEVPQEDKDLLTDIVLKAGNLLIDSRNPAIYISTGDTINGQDVVIIDKE